MLRLDIADANPIVSLSFIIMHITCWWRKRRMLKDAG